MRITRLSIFFCVFALLSVFTVHLTADEQSDKSTTADFITPPNERLYLGSLTILRYNPLGLETQNRLMYSSKLSDSESVLFRDTFLAGGLSTKLNPAYLKIGPLVEFQPIAVFNLRMGYEYLKYFGTMGYLQSFADTNVDFSDEILKESKDAAYSTAGHHLFAEPTLQMKVGKVAVRTKFPIAYWNLDLETGDNFFYDATFDTLIPNKEVVWANDSDLLYIDGKMTLGLRYSAVFPGNGLEHMRVGPIFAWTFDTTDYGSFNKPTLLVMAAWYLKHPDRKGTVPYILMGYSFSSDFL